MLRWVSFLSHPGQVLVPSLVEQGSVLNASKPLLVTNTTEILCVCQVQILVGDWVATIAPA